MFFLAISISYTLLHCYRSAKEEKKTVYQEPISAPMKALYLPEQALAHFDEGLLGQKTQSCRRSIESALKFLGFNSRPDRNQSEYFFEWDGKKGSLLEENKLTFKQLGGTVPEELMSYSFTFKKNEEEVSLILLENEEEVLSFPVKSKYIPETILVGDVKLDKNFLFKQRISWLGSDLFLQKYAREEYPKAPLAQRLDFTHSKEPYYCLVQEKDCLVWKENHWEPADSDSQDYPLMSIKKIASKHIDIEVWSLDGRVKECFTLQRAMTKSFEKIGTSLRFVGAKTKEKWSVESNKKRFTLQAGDWLLYENSEWKKLDSVEALDGYVEKINRGELFVVDQFGINEGKKILKGELFNTSRTEAKSYELPLEVDKSKK